MRAHKAGRPVNLTDLPVPPGNSVNAVLWRVLFLGHVDEYSVFLL